MRRFNIAGILSLIIILTRIITAQPDFIARIGSNELTNKEFTNRFELSPRILGDESDNPDSLKLDFLYSLIAEKLWSVEARNEGLENSDDFKFYYTPVEKALIRDQVFQNEITDKVKTTENDISGGMNKYIKILMLDVLASRDSSMIANLYSQLKKAGSIDSLKKLIPDMSPLISAEEIKFGDLRDEVLEDQLYKLRINEFTEPVRNGHNWFIFGLKSIKTNLPETSQDKFRDEVIKIIKNRRIRNLYDEFYKKYFGGYSIKADEKIFIRISDVFYEVITSELRSDDKSGIPDEYYLSENDIKKVKEMLGPDFLQKIFFNSGYGPVKVYDFLSDLTIVDVKFDTLDHSTVNKVLSNELKRFMQQETVYRLGIEMGVQYSDKLKSRIGPWKDNILAQLYKNKFNKQVKVADPEIEQYYIYSLTDSAKLNSLFVQKITVPDLDQVREILDLIDKGKSFEEITEGFKPEQEIKLDTVPDFDMKSLGESADIIAQLSSGEIYGPVKTADGYSIVRVIEKNNIPDSTRMKINDIKDNIRTRLFIDKLNNLLEDKTIELASKYGIIINRNFLQAENFSDVNMFVHQYLGFGGRIAAVPYTTPFYKWYHKWKSESGITP